MMEVYLVLGSPRNMPWRRMAVKSASREEVQLLINLVDNPDISISLSVVLEAGKDTPKIVREVYGEIFELPGQAGEVIRELLSWSE